MSQVGKIYFFGSLQDGFKVYPDSRGASSAFATYYNNTETDWVLAAKRTEEGTSYTYVRYGMLTSMTDGRHGSCLGISIEFLGCYFTDFAILREEIFEPVFGALVKENQLIGNHPSGLIAFVPYNLTQTKSYLDKKAQMIQEVITSKYSNYLRASSEITLHKGNTTTTLHPDSNVVAIHEIFQTGGAITISPKFNIENRSVTERLVAQNKYSESRILELENSLNYALGKHEMLKKATIESDALHATQLLKLQNEVAALHAALKDAEKKASRSEKKREPERKTEQPDPAPIPPRKEPGQGERRLTPKKAALGFVFLLVIAAVLAIAFCNDKDSRRSSLKHTEQPIRPFIEEELPPKPRPIVTIVPIKIIVDQQNLQRGYLSEQAFLTQNNNVVVEDMKGIKSLLTTFLLPYSEVVRQEYRNDPEALWEYIKVKNPTSIKSINAYLQKNSGLVVKDTPDLQDIFNDIIIY